MERLARQHELIRHEIQALAAANAGNTQNIAKLIEVTNQDADNIRRLERIVKAHEGGQ